MLYQVTLIPMTPTSSEDEIKALVQFAFFRPHLAELLQACRAEALDLLVLKGAALAETVYPRLSLRRFGDLDILVRQSEIVRARVLLESLGYAPDLQQWEELATGRYCQTNFFKHTERGAVVIELHTELINNPLFFEVIRFDDEGVWQRARSVKLAGEEARVLGVEDQLLHLCLHLACHTLAAPASLRDIHQICLVDRTDWLLLAAIAKRARAKAACFAGLYAARQFLGTAVPEMVLDELAPRFGRGLLQRLTMARVHDEAQSEKLRLPLLLLFLETPAARMNALWRIVIPTSRWLITHYYFEAFQETEPSTISRRAYSALLRVHWTSLTHKFIR